MISLKQLHAKQTIIDNILTEIKQQQEIDKKLIENLINENKENKEKIYQIIGE